jgi:hypothetical protein
MAALEVSLPPTTQTKQQVKQPRAAKTAVPRELIALIRGDRAIRKLSIKEIAMVRNVTVQRVQHYLSYNTVTDIDPK